MKTPAMSRFFHFWVRGVISSYSDKVSELRIISLLSSATEIVYALGLADFQVGRSHECNYPPSVLTLPVCTHPAMLTTGSSADIDRSVKQRLSSALSLYDVDAERIKKLRPTHILTQAQCKVCAVSLEDVERALQNDMSVDADVISLEPYALKDVWTDIKRVGDACGFHQRACQLIENLQCRMQAIGNRASVAAKPRVAAIEWLEPLMAAGNWVPELIQMAGGVNLFGEAGQHSPWMTWQELTAADPDVIVAIPCGFDLERTRFEMHWLTERPGWNQLRAVQDGRIYVCDGDQFMNRPGPRLVESLQIFAEIFHPATFAPALRGTGWDIFSA
jgi:iron complex transport system substrate-binding protein